MKADFLCKTVSEANKREHWAARHRRSKTQRYAAFAVTKSFNLGSPAKLPLTVMIKRIGPRLLDEDNLQRALKSIRDGIAESLGHDDAPNNGITWKYAQKKSGSNRLYRIEIEIEIAQAGVEVKGE
jgi:hypothetical protein